MEIINVKVGSPSQSTNVDIENPSQVNAEIKNVTINTGGASKAVLYYPQELTSEQKQQARANIDAASQKDLQDGVNEALEEAKESGDFNGPAGYTPVKGIDYFDGQDATVKIGPLSDLKELPELKIYQVTQEEYNDSYEAGTLDPNAVYVTPASEYLTEETDPTVPAWAKAPTKPSYTASEVGADPSGTAETKVSAHNVSTTAHNDIRLLIQDITTQLANFLDVDDTTVDQLSEVLTLINNNKGTLESLTTSKINVSAIVDNLTTSDSTKVLSAKQGVAIKALIDALQTAVNGKAKSSDLESHTSNKSNPHGVTAEQVGALPTEGGTMTGVLYGTSGIELTASGSSANNEQGITLKNSTNTARMSLGVSGGLGIYSDQTLFIRPAYSEGTGFGVKMTKSDMSPTTNNILSLGSSSSMQYNNIYGKTIYQNGKQVANKEDIPATTETWTFTLEDGSTVNKVVYVG